jgi:hypothetical protein
MTFFFRKASTGVCREAGVFKPSAYRTKSLEQGTNNPIKYEHDGNCNVMYLETCKLQQGRSRQHVEYNSDEQSRMSGGPLPAAYS